MPIHALLVLLHLLAAAYWVGGMAALLFAVRPAAFETLSPPQRMPLLAATLRRFLAGVGLAIVVLLASGLAMIALYGGFASVHWSVHAMLALGLVMMALYGHLRSVPVKRLQRAVAASDWSAGAATLPTIRKLVSVNLALGVAVFALAVVGRTLG